MDEIWERAVEAALEGQTEVASVRSLTLDGTVKCVNGRLCSPSILEKFPNLQHLSIANIGVSSLEEFPRLRNLQKLVLSDNRIAGGLEFLVEAGLEGLRDLDLSNNKIQEVGDLRALAELRIVSLDLYECPVTRVRDYRARVFGMIKTLKYLDKMDAEENERPESEEEDDEEEEEDEEEDDPGSGEVDGDGERGGNVASNGHREGSESIVEVDEDEESDADEEEMEVGAGVNGGGVDHHSNGFVDDEEDDDFIYDVDEDGSEEDDVVEVHEIDDSDDEEDVVEDEEEEEDEDDDDVEDEEEEDDDDEELDNVNENGEPESTGRLTSTEGEIDGHEQGEEDADEDDDGETGEEELGIEDGVDFDDEDDAEDEVVNSEFRDVLISFYDVHIFLILTLAADFVCFLCLDLLGRFWL